MNSFFRKSQTILFQGDSITDCGRDYLDSASLSEGYPGQVAKLYRTLFPNDSINFINKGVSGDRVRNLLERYEEDINKIRPDFISILVGINDTWRRYDSNDPTTPEDFKKTYTTLLENIKRDLPQTKIMIMEPFLLHTETIRTAWHEDDLDAKIQVVRFVARKYADYFLPLDGIFQSYLTEGYNESELSEDGVHPASQGHSIIAYEYLKALNII